MTYYSAELYLVTYYVLINDLFWIFHPNITRRISYTKSHQCYIWIYNCVCQIQLSKIKFSFENYFYTIRFVSLRNRFNLTHGYAILIGKYHSSDFLHNVIFRSITHFFPLNFFPFVHSATTIFWLISTLCVPISLYVSHPF